MPNTNENIEKQEYGIFSPKSLVGGVGITVVKKLIDLAKKKNEEDPDVKTVPGSLFDNIQDKLDNIKTQIKPGDSEEDIVKKFKEQIDEAKKENNENPDEETADDQFFDKIKGIFDFNKGKTEDDVLIDEEIEVDDIEIDFDGFDFDIGKDTNEDNQEIKAIKEKIRSRRKALNDKLKELRTEIREEKRKRMGELRALREEYVQMMTESGRSGELKKKKKEKKEKKNHHKGKGKGKKNK